MRALATRIVVTALLYPFLAIVAYVTILASDGNGTEGIAKTIIFVLVLIFFLLILPILYLTGADRMRPSSSVAGIALVAVFVFVLLVTGVWK